MVSTVCINTFVFLSVLMFRGGIDHRLHMALTTDNSAKFDVVGVKDNLMTSLLCPWSWGNVPTVTTGLEKCA